MRVSRWAPSVFVASAVALALVPADIGRPRALLAEPAGCGEYSGQICKITYTCYPWFTPPYFFCKSSVDYYEIKIDENAPDDLEQG